MPRMSLSAVGLLAVAAFGLLAAPAAAQFLPHYDDVRVTTLTYTNTGGERGTTTFDYGWDGRLRHSVWSLADGSRYSGNWYLYDPDGREIEKYREFSDAMTSRQLYGYDERGLCNRETFERSDGVKGSARFERDGEGRLKVAVCDNHRGWFTGRIVYAHAGDRLTGAEIRRDEEIIGTIAYRYDAGGHLSEETWDFGGTWSQTFGYVYEPVPAEVYTFGNPLVMQNSRYVVEAEDYDWNGEGGGPSDYTYEGDRLVEKIFTRRDGLKTVTTFAYDDDRDLATSHRLYNDGQTADFSYYFDDRRRLERKTFRHSDGRSGHEIYAYDRLGRLVGLEYENMDFWLIGKITLEHDLHGHLTGGHFTGRDGDDAVLEIGTDDHGNVTRIHWKFDSGKTQTYTFDYRAR